METVIPIVCNVAYSIYFNQINICKTNKTMRNRFSAINLLNFWNGIDGIHDV